MNHPQIPQAGNPARRRHIRCTGAVALVVALSACGGGNEASSGNGTLRLALTDAPSCGYDAVNVTVQKVRVHRTSTAGETDSGWSEVVLPSPRRIDLLTLTNGVLEELGETSLPAGKYTQLRLVLAPNDSASPMANAVTPTGGVETALTTPSGQQSGLKTPIDIDVSPNEVADFVLDFKVCESIVKRGNSGQYNLKPVIAMLPRLTDAGMRVVGYVGSDLDPASTTVSVQTGGVPMRATPPDANGKFVLYPVPAGNYDLVVNAQGRVTALVTGVPVTTTAYTHVNNETARIVPPVAPTVRNAVGTVNTGAVPVEATVRVLKAFTGGPNVELAAVPVDGVTGDFAFQLPAGAPVRATYVNAATPLVFEVDPAVPTGRYTLQAIFGAATKSSSIDLTNADSDTPITFP